VFAKSTDNLEAWKQLVMGQQFGIRLTKGDNAKAREHYKAALNIDPTFVSAMVLLSLTHSVDVTMGWSDSPSTSIKRAFQLVQEALKLDEQDPSANAILGGFYLGQRQHEKAIKAGKRSIALNPNYAMGHAFLASSMFFSGHLDEAKTLLEIAYRLDPKLPTNIWLQLRVAIYAGLEQYEEALEVCHQMRKHTLSGNMRKWIPPLLYSLIYQRLGREEDARAAMAEALKINPALSLEAVKMSRFYKNPAHLQRELDAYRKAGMPEKAPGAVP
jgi:adenylate cyclase